MTSTPTPHARTFGHGARQALAIHCTLAHSGAWRGLGAVLEGHFTLTAIDLPGHGKSADWDRWRDLHVQCRDAALAHLSDPMDVIGHSFGATIALRVAVEHPHLVRSLTLIEPVFFAAAMADAPEALAAHEIEAEPYFSALSQGDQTADIIDVVNNSLASRMPNARRVWITGAGHMVPITHPQEVAGEILKLVEMA